MTDDAELLVAQTRIRNILDFLKAFNRLRNPAVRVLPSADGKPIWWSDVPRANGVATARPGDDALLADDDGEDVILRVRRISTPPVAPPPPAPLAEWVQAGWEDAERQAAWAARRLDADGEPKSLTADEAAQLQAWKTRRDDWAAKYAPDFRSLALFGSLWSFHQLFQRESERLELTLGDGHVAWDAPGGVIEHPVLLQPVDLRFNDAIPEFTVALADQRPAEFADGIFRSSTVAETGGAQAVDGETVGRFRAEVGSSGTGPFDNNEANDFLWRLAIALDPAGRLVRDGQLFERGEQHPKPGPALQVFRDPVLFVRPRSSGYERAIEGCLLRLEEMDPSAMPESLLALVGYFPPAAPDAGSSTLVDPFAIGDEEDALLTKQANREQLGVVRRLQKHSNVLVQGPPGTGKTHTIANVLGHLLAEGKSVLVTAQTPKALRVLREKVVEPLQPLCVSVLEGDAAANAQLRDSALKIADRISRSTVSELARDAERLRTDRAALLGVIKGHRDELFALVRSEYQQVEIAGSRGTPSQAARYLTEHAGANGWIPGEVHGVAPLSPAEVARLYATNAELTEEDVRHIALGLPDPARLPAPADFEEMLTRVQEATAPAAMHAAAWRPAERARATVEALAAAILPPLGRFAVAEEWCFEAAHAGAGGDAGQRGWTALQAALNDWARAEHASESERSLHGPESSLDWPPEKLPAVLDEMAAHLRGGDGFGRLTLLRHGDWKDVLEGCRTIDGRPVTLEAIDALRAGPLAAVAKREARQRWGLVLGQLEPPFPADRVEAARRASEIGAALDAGRDVIAPVVERSRALGLDLPGLISIGMPFSRPSEWKQWAAEAHLKLPAVLNAELARLTLQEFESTRSAALGELARFHAGADSDAPANRLATALEAGGAGGYASAHERLLWLLARVDVARTRDALLKRLEERAPAWASQIRLRKGGHGGSELPGDPAQAWTWSLLSSEIARLTNRDSAPLVEAIATNRRTLSTLTAELVDRRAWHDLMNNMSPQASAALKAYAVAAARSRGSGKTATRMRRAARDQMAAARGAVPVWIAPLYRVAETFDPRAQFDVVIIDEASQLDVTGLLAWFFGKQVIVVGDDQQVTPSAVGQRIDGVEALMRMFLSDIPLAPYFDGQTSIYHLAQIVFGGVVKLREHFRCVPDIIGFSNGLSYNWEILPLREAGSGQVFPPTVDEYLPDGARGGSGQDNIREAEQVASLLIAATEQPEYRDLTFGVISLLAVGTQAQQIERLIHRELSPDVIERRRILCGTPPQFQGDERDVIFLSMVDGPAEDPPHTLRDASAMNETFKKRYNVAASRSRDQLWVVHSVRRDIDLKPGDLRRQLIEHALDPSAQRSQLAMLKRKEGSPFEGDVGRRLISRGFAVESQHPAGAYFIDLLVGDPAGGKTLAVECDGGYHFASDDQIRDDLDRQALLERLGYTFHRVRGAEFYRDPDSAMERLFARLAAMGIEPGSSSDRPAPPDDSASELIERVRQRAAEIRAKWSGPQARRAPPQNPDPTGNAPDPNPGGDTGPEVEPPLPSAAPSAASGVGVQLPPIEGHFPTYQQATLAGLRIGHDIGDEPDSILHPLILEIARVEGPVHFDLVLDRLRVHYGANRLREAKRNHIQRSVERLARKGEVEMARIDAGEDFFVSLPGVPAVPRAPGIQGTRASRHFAPVELQAAVVAVSGRFRTPRALVADEAASRLGFRRISEQLRAALELALTSAVTAGQLVEDRGFIRAP